MKCRNAVLQGFNGKAIRQGTGRQERQGRVSGLEGQWCRARDTKRLHSLEGNIFVWVREGWRERERGGEVISPPEHIHFTVFSSTLPLDITSHPLQVIIPLFTITHVAKTFTYTHVLPYSMCTLTPQKKTASFPERLLEEARDLFSSAAHCRYRVSATTIDILLILLSISVVK